LINQPEVASTFRLISIYPNPFNPDVTFHFSMPGSERVQITLYNIVGKKVAAVYDGFCRAGEHKIKWTGPEFSSGLYLAVIKGNTFRKASKILLLK